MVDEETREAVGGGPSRDKLLKGISFLALITGPCFTDERPR